MVDTIGIYYSLDRFDEGCLEHVRFNVKKQSGESTAIGDLKNLRVRYRGNALGVVGSLAKYYYGNNVVMMDMASVKIALEMLSDSLHVDVTKGNIYRLDIGYNFHMKEPVWKYLGQLGNCKFMKKAIFGTFETVNFTNKSRALVFYDKNLETCHNNSTSQVRNLLRYELQLKKKPASYFDLDKIKVHFLYDVSFYNQMIDVLCSHYFMVTKIHQLIINPRNFTNKKLFNNTLMNIGINAFGYDNVLAALIEAKKPLMKNRMTFSRLRNAA